MSLCNKCNGFGCSACQSLEKLENIDESLKKTGDDIKGVSERLDELVDAEHKTAEAISEGLGKTAEAISEGLGDVAETLNKGFSGLMAQFDAQLGVLSSICGILENPRSTQADELRRMADEARKRGLLPKAEELYLESLELNPLDYRTYVGIAQTCVQQNNLEKAKSFLEQSLPHAPKYEMPKYEREAELERTLRMLGNNPRKKEIMRDFDWKSYSYRLLAHIAIRQNDPQGAINHLHSAIQYTPKYTEGLYELAQFCAITGKQKESVAALEKAINTDATIFERAKKDKVLSKQEAINGLLENMYSDSLKRRNEIISYLDHKLSVAHKAIARARNAANIAREEGPSTWLFGKSMSYVKRLKKWPKDYATNINIIVQEASVAESKIEEVISEAKKEQKRYEDIRKKKVRSAWSAVPRCIIGYPLIGAILGTITGCSAGCTYELITSTSDPALCLFGGFSLGGTLGLGIGIYEIRKKLN